MIDIPRDHFKRPKIMPLDGGPLVPYTRISTVSETFNDQHFLTNWKLRNALIGLSGSSEMVAAVKTAGTDRELDSLARDAINSAGGSDAARYGTRIHEITEYLDAATKRPAKLEGLVSDDFATAEMLPDLESYQQAVSTFTPVSAEQFVVIDDMKVGGSYDRIYELPNGKRVIADIKTGSRLKSLTMSVSIQLALYAAGRPYDPETGQRSEPLDVAQDYGLLIWIPRMRGFCEIHKVDLKAGMLLAQRALVLRNDWRKRTWTTRLTTTQKKKEN